MSSMLMNKMTPLSVIAAAALAVGLIGCSSSPPPTPKAGGLQPVETRMSAISAVDQMKADLKATDEQIKLNQASLHNLTDQQYGDLRPAYTTFEQNVTKTEALGDQLNQDASQVSSKSYAYVSNWDYNAREIRDNAMRDGSISRQEQARKEQTNITSQMNALHGAYVQYLQTLRDAQTFAANDLTPEGMKQLRDHAPKVNESAKSLRQTIANINGDLSTMASSWGTDVSEPAEWGGAPKATPAGGMMPGEPPTPAPSK